MTAAVIVAAGQGLRLGGSVPKAMRIMAGKPLYAYSLEAAKFCPLIQFIVVVVPTDYLASVATHCKLGAGVDRVQVRAGGVTRQQSVLQGVLSLPADVEWVAVHDAARPLVTGGLFHEVIQLALEKGGALSAHPASDTVKRQVRKGSLVTLPRDELWHAETPQVFRRTDLELALVKCESERLQVTDEAEAMERLGFVPSLYPNADPNPKISTEADWLLVEAMMQNR